MCNNSYGQYQNHFSKRGMSKCLEVILIVPSLSHSFHLYLPLNAVPKTNIENIIYNGYVRKHYFQSIHKQTKRENITIRFVFYNDFVQIRSEWMDWICVGQTTLGWVLIYFSFLSKFV